MEYNIFINEWIGRADRKENEDCIDIGDKFISLWIAFNAWMKSEFESEAKLDRDLKESLIGFLPMKTVFDEFKKGNKDLVWLRGYVIKDMRYPDDKSKNKSYDGSFESLVESLYAVRCNLFHGRKNFNDNQTDKELVELAYKILSPLFKKYLEK